MSARTHRLPATLAAAMLEHAADATWTADADGAIQWIAGGQLDQYGLIPEEVVGSVVFDWIHPEDAEVFRETWQRLVSRASLQEVVQCRLTSPGRPDVWVQKRLTDLRDDPRVAAICGTVVDISARVKEEQRRALQQRRLRAGFEQSGVAQGVLSIDGRFIEVNPALCALVGRSREALLGMHVREITHPSDAGHADSVLTRLAGGELEHGQAERLLSGPDNRPLPVLVDVTLLRDVEGAPDALVGHLHDLSALRSAQRRQQQQEDFFLALSRNASDFAVVSDPQQQILYVSPALRNVLGYESLQVLGEDGFDFTHPDDLDSVQQIYEQVITHGGSATFTARLRAADDSWRWMEGTATNLLDTAVGGIVTNLRDVTDRVVVERELVVAQQRYRDVFTSTSLGILLIDMNGEILEVNEALCRLIGYSREELLGRHAPDFLAGAADLTAEQRRERAQALGASGYELEEVFLRRDGTELPVVVTVNRIEQPDGGSQLSLVVSDQSRLKELQAKALRGERHEAAGRVAAGVVHDTNNILAAVSGYAEMLGAAVAGQPEAERHLDGIRRSIDRANDMVAQLLAFSRGQQLTVARIDLREVVEDLEDMLRRLLPRGVRLTVDARPAPTQADHSQVRQVVLNLVVNAREAVQGHGDVHLSTGLREVQDDDALPPGTYAVITVEDDGAGMEESIARRCFEPFFSTRVAQGGSGLGLSTAHGIARQSGGDLRVRTAPGKGATFELLLPATTAGSDVTERQAEPTSARQSAVSHVLVVDDDDELRSLVVQALEGAGYRVAAAADGRDALDAGVVPDLLLTDLEMPRVNGHDLSAALRERHPELPVLFMSGHDSVAVAPPDEFLAKPFALASLLEHVAALLADRGRSG